MLNDAAIIFEGGGMRGAYTAGVIDALIENDMEFTSCYGVSSGACHATTYLSKQFGRARKIIVNYAHDKRYFSLRSLFKTGNMFGIEFIFKTLTHELEPYDFETARNNPAKFYVGVINVKTAESEYLLIRDPDEEYMKLAATMALPIISKKVKLNGKKYLDGGIVDSLPIKQAFAAGNKKVVLVLTQDATYRKSINKILPLLWFWYLPYQKFVGKIATRHIRYNKALIDIAEAEKAGTAFVIRPKKPVEVGRLDFNPEKIEALYQDGYRDGLELMPKLKEFLKS
ncbi:MAG TPA: patatin family protein [Methanocorpusculum sp.]|nr:patatin family protein [Methanocorpusculum sp.]HJJ27463.1 patatin family protein [Methanocorpusculum sp.]